MPGNVNPPFAVTVTVGPPVSLGLTDAVADTRTLMDAVADLLAHPADDGHGRDRPVGFLGAGRSVRLHGLVRYSGSEHHRDDGREHTDLDERTTSVCRPELHLGQDHLRSGQVPERRCRGRYHREPDGRLTP